jgi:hypothetical protein
LVFGFWFLVFGFWFLVFGFWFLVFGFWFLVFGFWFLKLDAFRKAKKKWCPGPDLNRHDLTIEGF